MILCGLTPYLLSRLAARLTWRGRLYSRSDHQIFVLHSCPAVMYLHRTILPLTHQRLGLCRPIALFLRLEPQKMPPVLHHPIVANPSFRLSPESLSQLRCARCPNVIVLSSSRCSRKSSIVFRKIFRFQIFIRSFVALDPLATQFLHQAILMDPVVALYPPFRLWRTGGNNANLQALAHAPKMRRGRFPMQALPFRRLPLINVLPIGIQRSRYPIFPDPASQHSYRRPDRFLLPQPTARRRRGIIHHIHQTSAWSPLLKPRMETPIHLHQVAKVLPPFPALAVRFPSSHAAPQPLR